MKLFNYLSNHKIGILTVLLVAAAAALGADGAFAMAIDPVELAGDENPGGEGPKGTLPGGMSNRADVPGEPSEKPQEDLTKILRTQMFGKDATATDVRDAGLEAEDFDPVVVLFNKFKYASETMLASAAKPVKVNSYVVEHFRIGQPDLDAVFYPSESVSIAASDDTIELDFEDFSNGEVLTPYSTVIVEGVPGYTQDAGGNGVIEGNLQLYVLSVEGGKVTFKVINGPKGATTITLASGTTYKFLVCASAGYESQMRVAPVTFLPDRTHAILQKKIETAIITDAFKEQSKKTPIGMSDVIKYTTDIFKRKCARSHWLGTEGRADVKTSSGNREAAYMEKGILRQISMLYTHGEELQYSDLMAMSAMMFTQWAQSEKATAFVGKKEMQRIMNLVNSAVQHKDVSQPTVNEFGIIVRKYRDNFGEIEFVYDQTLDELGYSEAAVVLDLSSIVRYYMRDDKVQTQDMKKTGEAREAEVWNISRIDCYCLKGGNALIACPSSFAADVTKLGGITSEFEKASTGATLAGLDKTLKYYLEIDLAPFKKGTIIEYDKDLQSWKQFEGRIFA